MTPSPLRIAIMLTVITSITVGMHYYIFVRLVRDPVLPEPWFGIARTAIIALAVLMPTSFFIARAVPRPLGSPVMWVSYLWMGLSFFLLVFLGASDLVRGSVALATKLFAGAGVDSTRRLFLARALGAGVGFSAMGVTGAGLFSVLRPVGVQRVRVSLERFPAELSGYTIVQLSDVHVGPTIGQDFIEQLVATTNALQPDMVAITGDLVDGSVAELGRFVEPLKNLRARDGVYFVTGNHEYYSGADEWIAFLRSLGIRVLRNERVTIRGESGFDLAGVDDWSARGGDHGPDLPRAMAGRDASRAVVLLAHQPKAIVEASQLGVGLQLSGHTHGGQMYPFNYLVKLDQPYIDGLHTHGATKIYVSRGTGYWGPPVRVGAPAEITRIELHAAG